jgi:putative redox protein
MATANVKIVLEDADGYTFRAEFPTGHQIKMDIPEDSGGADEGPRPMQVMLAALGGCTGIDVMSILNKMKQPVEGYEIHIEADQSEEHPKVYTEIRVTHVIRGDVEDDRAARAVELSSEKYCSVSAQIKQEGTVKSDYRQESD